MVVESAMYQNKRDANTKNNKFPEHVLLMHQCPQSSVFESALFKFQVLWLHEVKRVWVSITHVLQNALQHFVHCFVGYSLLSLFLASITWTKHSSL